MHTNIGNNVNLFKYFSDKPSDTQSGISRGEAGYTQICAETYQPVSAILNAEMGGQNRLNMA